MARSAITLLFLLCIPLTALADPPVVMTVTLEVVETAEYYTWSLYFDGTDGEMVYDDVMVYYAQVAIDGSWGSFTFYDVMGDPGDVVFSWDWSTSSEGVFTMTMIGGSGDDAAKLVFVVNPDGSGTLDFYEWANGGWQLVYAFEWDSAGNGSWIYYEDGVQVDADSWVVTKTG